MIGGDIFIYTCCRQLWDGAEVHPDLPLPLPKKHCEIQVHKTHQDWQGRKLRFIGRHTIRSTIHLKREAPPSATTLSTLAAWQRRILKKNNVERVGWRKMIWKRNADRTWLNNWLVQFLFLFFFLHDRKSTTFYFYDYGFSVFFVPPFSKHFRCQIVKSLTL